MNVAQAAAEIFKREGVEFLLAYPLNPLTESCAAAGTRPIIVRQERVGLHMADAISRTTSGLPRKRCIQPSSTATRASSKKAPQGVRRSMRRASSANSSRSIGSSMLISSGPSAGFTAGLEGAIRPPGTEGLLPAAPPRRRAPRLVWRT